MHNKDLILIIAVIIYIIAERQNCSIQANVTIRGYLDDVLLTFE